MNHFDWKKSLQNFDAKRDIIIAGDKAQTIDFCVKQFIAIGQEALAERGSFFVALSGGSTPNAIYKALSQLPYKDQLDWTRVYLFWSDERPVPPNHPESNYHNAMQAGLAALNIPPENIYRMQAEGEIEEQALAYEKIIRDTVPALSFDLIMLGMGEDGHTASLFPETHGLHVNNRLVTANYVPQKNTWRMSLTYECIHSARRIALYILGQSKAEIVKETLTGAYQPDIWPVQRIGTNKHKAMWILDNEASEKLIPALGLTNTNYEK